MRLIDLVTPKRWLSVAIWLLQTVLNKLGEDGQFTPQVHEIEQYMYRYLQCPDCLAAKQCKSCGCKIPERMHVKTDHCSEFRWGPIMDAYEWDRYKSMYNINFSLTYEVDSALSENKE